MIYDLLIIGGGVSGVSSYIGFKRKNKDKSCLIIEHKDSLLKKLNMTGNGKCNFTNEYLNKDCYVNGSYFDETINNKSLFKILKFFDYLNIKYYKDDEGRYYPASETAKTVVNKMLEKVSNDDILLSTNVLSIKKENNTFIVNTDKGEFKALNLLISVGSKNYSITGSDGSLFEEISKLKHTFTDLIPSNIWINVKEKDITSKLSGLRVKANLRLFNNSNLIHEEMGELLFKDESLSGIVSFNVSNYIANLYKNHIDNNIKVLVDFAPNINDNLEDLKSYLHPVIADTIIKYQNKYDSLYDLIKNFEFNVTSLGDFKYAQVTCGGINIIEVKPNFESKIIDNLYFSGDVLDVSAPCGGFNLSFAILSGLKVGEEVE